MDDRIEARLPVRHCDAAGNAAEIHAATAPQRIEHARDAGGILGVGQHPGECIGVEAQQAKVVELVAALAAHRRECAGGAPALAFELQVDAALA